MSASIDKYYLARLTDLAAALEKNHFNAVLCDNKAQARKLVLNELIPKIKPKTAAFGGSGTVESLEIPEALMKNPDIDVIDTFDKKLTLEEKYERRRQSLLVDLYFLGANAITEDGRLVNLDCYGNRVGALIFGPKNVIVVAGRNKLVADLSEAMNRNVNYAAPVNAIRLNRKTPCVKTSRCQDCSSPDRICNVWTVHEKCQPPGRSNVVLINQDLGF